MSEVEAKFLLSDPGDSQRLAGWIGKEGGGESLPACEIEDRYFDTPDWRLYGEGWAYRWRSAGKARKAALKSVEGGNGLLTKRKELEQRVEAFPKKGGRLEKGQVGEVLEGLGALPLRELFRLRNRRKRFLVKLGGGGSAEVALDRVEVRASVKPEHLAPGTLCFEELEVELKNGRESALEAFAEELRDRFHLQPSRLGKFDRGLQAVGLSVPLSLHPGARRVASGWTSRPLQGGPGRWKEKDQAGQYGRAYLREQFQRLVVEEPKAFEGLDPEGVHRMRVATRRLRAGLKAFSIVLPREGRKRFARELKWIAHVLGNVRDLDVLRAREARSEEDCLGKIVEWRADYREFLRTCWKSERETLKREFAGERYQAFVADFREFLAADSPKGMNTTIGRLAAESLGRLAKRVARSGKGISAQSSDEELHRLRIDCKRLRYMMEIYVPAIGKPVRQGIKQLREIQNVLGEFQDACVAADSIRRYMLQVRLTSKGRIRVLAAAEALAEERFRALAQRGRFDHAWKRAARKAWIKRLRTGFKNAKML